MWPRRMEGARNLRFLIYDFRFRMRRRGAEKAEFHPRLVRIRLFVHDALFLGIVSYGMIYDDRGALSS